MLRLQKTARCFFSDSNQTGNDLGDDLIKQPGQPTFENYNLHIRIFNHPWYHTPQFEQIRKDSQIFGGEGGQKTTLMCKTETKIHRKTRNLGEAEMMHEKKISQILLIFFQIVNSEQFFMNQELNDIKRTKYKNELLKTKRFANRNQNLKEKVEEKDKDISQNIEDGKRKI